MWSATACDLPTLHKPPSGVNGKVSPQSYSSTWRSFDACPNSVFPCCFVKLRKRNKVINLVKWLLCWLDDVDCLGQSLASDVTRS